MEDAQHHRGPDGSGARVESVGDWNVGLGHQRLAIIDLSEGGAQPMASSSRRHLISYNGEVYNYRELRESLQVPLHGDSDTEVMLECMEQRGVHDSLARFNGMWAFALLDRQAQRLYLCRDRVGIKPLYLHLDDDGLVFASEIKAVLAGVGRRFALNPRSVHAYATQALQDTSNETFFEGIESLPPGHVGVVDLSGPTLTLSIEPYWKVPTSAASTPAFGEACDRFANLFSDAVRLRMRSDVPLGVTLSGGIDSSAIASRMVDAMGQGRKPSVLSAVSPGSVFDESGHIDTVADALGLAVDKVELDFSPERAEDLVREATWHNDAPLGSFSNVAYLLLMRKARSLGLKVVLSGQGADELLCGYKKYLGFHVQALLRSGRPVSALLALAGFVVNRTIVTQFNVREARRYLPWLARKRGGDTRGPALRDLRPVPLGLAKGETLQQRQARDVSTFSVPYLTHYEDRMSMACSVEVRLPFLDYRLIEHTVPLPADYKLRRGWTKYLFRNTAEHWLPASIVWRKDKKGFESPEETWLHDGLRRRLRTLFAGDALIYRHGLFDRDALCERYERYLRAPVGAGDVWYREIFAPFALEMWLEVFHEHLLPPADSPEVRE